MAVIANPNTRRITDAVRIRVVQATVACRNEDSSRVKRSLPSSGDGVLAGGVMLVVVVLVLVVRVVVAAPHQSAGCGSDGKHGAMHVQAGHGSW